jgi:hypothetical protein
MHSPLPNAIFSHSCRRLPHIGKHRCTADDQQSCMIVRSSRCPAIAVTPLERANISQLLVGGLHNDAQHAVFMYCTPSMIMAKVCAE